MIYRCASCLRVLEQDADGKVIPCPEHLDGVIEHVVVEDEE